VSRAPPRPKHTHTEYESSASPKLAAFEKLTSKLCVNSFEIKVSTLAPSKNNEKEMLPQ